MLKTEEHPFNFNIGRKTISTNTRKLFVGTFPAFEVVNLLNPRLYFYYGSNDNKFWDIVREVFPSNFEFTEVSIRQFLSSNNLGVVDIIEKCYRKGNRSSSDEDLTIIEQLDIIDLLQTTNCRDIYTTSKLVTDLTKKQIKPIANKYAEHTHWVNEFKYEILDFCLSETGKQFQIRIFTLYSPSDNGLRGIQKGLNNRQHEIKAEEYRKNQYKELLNVR